MEQTFRDAWLEVICKEKKLYDPDGNLLKTFLQFKGIAANYGLDEEELRQNVAVWFSYEKADQLEDFTVSKQEDINYVVSILNSQTTDIAKMMQIARFQSAYGDGHYQYSKDEIRAARHKLAESIGTHIFPGSDAHAVLVDFEKAFRVLTPEEQAIFLTPTMKEIKDHPELIHYGQYPGSPQSKENQAFRNRKSDILEDVWRIMNDSHFRRGGAISE